VTRSRKNQPYRPMTTANSEKEDKRIANREERRINRRILDETQDGDMLRITNEVSDPWKMDKDGKVRFDPGENPKSLRK